jgi:hypothetical protein
VTKALSIRSPWWWFILHAGKDIENRDWSTRFRGTVLIHSSKRWQKDEIFDDLYFCDRVANTQVRDSPMLLAELRYGLGCIVGQVDIIDCVTKSDSPWFFGDYGFVLANPIAYAVPVPCRGALGFFDVQGQDAAAWERLKVVR